MLNNAKLAGQPARIEVKAVQAPMLIVSAEDDRFGIASTAWSIHARAPNAALHILPTCGHILLGHNEEVVDLMDHFIATNPTA